MTKGQIFSHKMLEKFEKRVYDINKIFDAALAINGIKSKISNSSRKKVYYG
jgi:hypothetical protein